MVISTSLTKKCRSVLTDQGPMVSDSGACQVSK